MVIIAVMGVPMDIRILPSFESDEEDCLKHSAIFYADMFEQIPEDVLNYSIDEIMVVGPTDYAEGIARNLAKEISSDDVKVYAVNMYEE